MVSDTWRADKLYTARSRLYRSRFCKQILVGMLSPREEEEHSALHLSNLNFFVKNNLNYCWIFCWFLEKTANNSASFNENFEIRERCKGVHCVDLGESFPTSIYLQKSASIQPRTSRSKFGSQITLLITYRASCSFVSSRPVWLTEILSTSRFSIYSLRRSF